MKVYAACCYMTKSGSRWIKIASKHKKKSVHIYVREAEDALMEIDRWSKLTETKI